MSLDKTQDPIYDPGPLPLQSLYDLGEYAIFS